MAREERKNSPLKEKRKMPEIKLFGKWGFEGIEIKDPGLKNVISLKPVFIPHSKGRHASKRFGKSKVSLVERLVNNLMRTRKGTGKKQRAINIVRKAFEIVHLKTGKNPIEVLVRAVENAAPREEVTGIMYGGIVYHKAVDVAPLRRVDLALRFIVEAVKKETFNNIKNMEEILADVLIATYRNDPSRSLAVKKKAEIERRAYSAA